jgi:hypothetical protein
VAICGLGGRTLMATQNSFPMNEEHDTSITVRAVAACVCARFSVPLQKGSAFVHAHLAALASHNSHRRPQEGIWLAWSLFVDPATMPEAEGTLAQPLLWLWRPLTALLPHRTACVRAAGLKTRVVAAIIVIIGICYMAILLALIVDAVQGKMRELKLGRTSVVENGHAVILGWTDETVNILRELALANASEGGGCVTVLSSRPKSELDHELNSALKPAELHGTRVVFRSGSRLRVSDLHKVSTETARVVLVISDSRLAPHAADAEVIQVVLSLSTLRLARATNVVAEVRLSESEALLHLVSKGSVAVVPTHDLCGALMLQFARQPGLAGVYAAVLGFHGSEFYTKRWACLEGRAFGELAPLIPDAVPIGVVDAAGDCVLNPPASRRMAPGDQLVVLAEDDDSYAPHVDGDGHKSAKGALADAIAPTSDVFLPYASTTPPPERVFLAGWRRDVPLMIELLDRLAAPGSELHIVCLLPIEERMAQITEAGLAIDSLHNLRVFHHVGNSAMRRHMEALPLERCTSMIIAADVCSEEDVIKSDSQCLATLLLVRSIQAARQAAAAAAAATALPEEAAAPAAAAVAAGAPADEAPAASESEVVLSPLLPVIPRRHAGVAWGFHDEVLTASEALPIVVEILDPRTQRTVTESHALGRVSDWMQSTDLTSKILAMVAEDVRTKTVLDQLLGGTGTQFRVTPAASYVRPDALVSFAELAAHCSAVRDCVLCGFIHARGPRGAPACVLNPEDKHTRRSWEGCGLVVIATDARLIKAGALTACMSMDVLRL